MAKKAKPHGPYKVPFTVLVDSAESQPFAFDCIMADADKDYRLLAIPRKFASLGRHPNSRGDYSIEGLEHCVAVERKSMEDAQGTVLGWASDYERQQLDPGRRDRFEKELENLAQLDAAVVVVEATLGDCLRQMGSWGKKSAELNAKIFHRSVLAYMQDYRVPWVFCDNRRHAETATFRFLHRFWKKRREAERKARKTNEQR